MHAGQGSKDDQPQRARRAPGRVAGADEERRSEAVVQVEEADGGTGQRGQEGTPRAEETVGPRAEAGRRGGGCDRNSFPASILKAGRSLQGASDAPSPGLQPSRLARSV